MRDSSKDQLTDKIRSLKERQEELLNLTKVELDNLTRMEDTMFEKLGLRKQSYGESKEMQLDPAEAVPFLKDSHKRLISKSKELRNLRQTQLYAATDYFIYEVP